MWLLKPLVGAMPRPQVDSSERGYDLENGHAKAFRLRPAEHAAANLPANKHTLLEIITLRG